MDIFESAALNQSDNARNIREIAAYLSGDTHLSPNRCRGDNERHQKRALFVNQIYTSTSKY